MTLTTTDIQLFQQMLDLTLEQKFKEKLDPVKEQIAHLPTKEEFYKKMDKWMKAASTAEIEKSLHKRHHEQIRKFLSSPSVI